jgi:alpha-glucosidase
MGGTQAPVELSVPNLTGQTVNVYWNDFNCVEQLTDTIAPDGIFYESTFDGHEWVFRDPSGQEISRFITSSGSPMVMLGGGSFNANAVQTNCSSQGTTTAADLRVINNTTDNVLLFWIDTNCVEWLYWVVPANDRIDQSAWVGHDWIVRQLDGTSIEHRTLVDGRNRIVIDPPAQSASATPTAAPGGTAVAPAFPVTESQCEVTPITADMPLDLFYTKYCEYEGLRFIASDNVDDEALERAWLAAANMFFERPDLVEALVELGFNVVIIGEEEVMLDVPELGYRARDMSVNWNEYRTTSKSLELPRLAMGPEENLLCLEGDQWEGSNILVGQLGTIARFALVTNIDPSFTDELTAAREEAIANGTWAVSDWMVVDNTSYWEFGVATYFNSNAGAMLTGPTDDFTNTRDELATFDPKLHDLVDSVFQAEDWTPTCPE